MTTNRRRCRSRATIESVELLQSRRMLSTGALALGAESLVNTHTQNDQANPVVAMDSAGDYVAVWSSEGQDGDRRGIYAQRYNASGVPQGGEFRVNSTTTNDQTSPSVAIDATGDFVVTWTSFLQDGDLLGVYAQRFNSAGVAQGIEFRVNSFTTGTQYDSKVAMDAAGNFVIAWYGDGPALNSFGQGAEVYAQRYDAAGNPLSGQFGVSSTTAGGGVPAIAMDAAGDFVVVWPGSTGVMAQRFDSSGTAVGTVIQVNTDGGEFPTVAMDANGDFVVAWDHIYGPNVYTHEYGIYAQRFDSAGTAQGNQLIVSPLAANTQRFASATADATGNFVITWQNIQSISARRYDSTGMAQGDVFQVNTSPGIKSNPAVATDSSEFVVLWDSDSQDGSGQGIVSQRYSVTMTPALHGLDETITYQQKAAPISVGPDIVVTAPTGHHIVSATVTITNWQGEDRLEFYNSQALQHSFTQDLNAHTATLTITGVASASAYQTLLRSVTYQDVAGNPITGPTRVATITVSDGTSTASGVQNIRVAAVLAGLGLTRTYVQGAAAMPIAPDLVVTLPLGQNVSSGTVSFTNWQREDRLSFFNSLALQHTFVQDPVTHTATLTITGNASAAGYQTLLRSVVYQDVAGNPNTSAVRIATIALNAGTFNSSATQNIRAATVLSGFKQTITYVRGAAPLTIAPNLVVTVPDDGNVSSATVAFTNWQGEDRLSFYNSLGLQHLFTQDLNAHTATLTITGSASAAGYQTLLRSVRYQDVAGKPISSSRTAKLTINANSLSGSGIQTINVQS